MKIGIAYERKGLLSQSEAQYLRALENNPQKSKAHLHQASTYKKSGRTEAAIKEIARMSAEVNEKTENIGARRLHTVMERLLESVSFAAADRSGDIVTIDRAYVDEHLSDLAEDEDLSRYIL